MTFKEKVVVQILLLLAGWLAPTEWKQEIHALDTHIRVNAGDGAARG